MLLALAAAALAIAVYGGALGHDFVTWDDPAYVQENLPVQQHRYGELMRRIVCLNYHPLTMLSLALDAGPPLSPRRFLATNVALHGLNTLLVFGLAWLLSRRRAWVAFLAALLFGLHPLHVESVAWISERKDVLYAAFFLAAAIAYLRYLDSRAWPWLAATFGLFSLSCLSKGMAVTFPGVMVLLDLWKARPLGERRAVLEKLPFLAVSLVVGWIAVDVQAGGNLHGLLLRTDPRAHALAAAAPFTLLQRLGFASYGYAAYLVRFFVPVGLSAFYAYPEPAAANQLQYQLAPLFVLGTLVLAAWDLRRSRLLFFGLGWFLVNVVLVLQVLPVGAAMMADRYTYVSYVGPGIALALGIARVADRHRAGRALWGAGFLFVALLAPLTGAQVRTWRDTDALWSNVLRRQDGPPLAYVARGTWRGRHARLGEARQDLERALALGYTGADAYLGLGIVLGSQGRADSALAMFGRALASDPGGGMIYFNRALTWLQIGRPDSALADLDRAEPLLGAQAAQVHAPRGYALLQLGAPARAIADFDQAIAANGADVASLFYRGTSRLRLGDRPGAAADFRAALALDPGHAGARAALRSLEAGPR